MSNRKTKKGNARPKRRTHKPEKRTNEKVTQIDSPSTDAEFSLLECPTCKYPYRHYRIIGREEEEGNSSRGILHVKGSKFGDVILHIPYRISQSGVTTVLGRPYKPGYSRSYQINMTVPLSSPLTSIEIKGYMRQTAKRYGILASGRPSSGLLLGLMIDQFPDEIRKMAEEIGALYFSEHDPTNLQLDLSGFADNL